MNIRANILQSIRDRGGIASDGPLSDSFIKGWAVHPFVGRGRAHWWTRVDTSPIQGITYVVDRLCGGDMTLETSVIHLLGPGNVPKCKNCRRIVTLRIAA